MKVLCTCFTGKYSHQHLIIGKWFDVDVEEMETYKHPDNDGKYCLYGERGLGWFDKAQFVTEQEHRDKKLKTILG